MAVRKERMVNLEAWDFLERWCVKDESLERHSSINSYQLLSADQCSDLIFIDCRVVQEVMEIQVQLVSQDQEDCLVKM